MNKIMVITYADLSQNSGNVALIARRAEAIYNKFGIKTICMTITKKNYNYNHNYQGVNFQTSVNVVSAVKSIKECNPDTIIFYGAKSYFLIKKIRKKLKKSKILIDLQGAFEERIEYGYTLKRFFYYKVEYILFKLASVFIDAILVVSDELEEYCRKILKNQNIKYLKINCGVSNVISVENKLKWRSDVRIHLGIEKYTNVFVFSGYRMPWQNIDRIISLFKKIDEKYANSHFAFFCNIDDDFNQQLAKEFPKGNYTAKFLKSEDYFKFLSACDVGVIIRDYNMTNKVAFPNKYSDYLNAGLIILMNDAVPSINKFSNVNEIPSLIFSEDGTIENQLIESRKLKLSEYYIKVNDIIEMKLTYESQVLDEFSLNKIFED
jgi:glycosyltransferase involved in cell wall biosynthesis